METPNIKGYPVVAFDVDGTLIDGHDMPRRDIVEILLTMNAYCRIIVWSGSGASYAEMWGRRLFLPQFVQYREKGSLKTDICFDDEDVNLATVNIGV